MITIAVLPIMNGKDFPAAGEALYLVIMKNIDIQDRIVLNMEGVPLLPSMFLNTSIGRIINERGVDYLKSKITFSNIKASDANRVREYVQRFN